MSQKQRNQPLWDYLEKAGVLEQGSDADIKAAKRAYRKQYLLEFKRRQRSSKPEYTIHFAKENGEFDRVAKAASRHRLTVTGFIRAATLAYIDNKYLVPDRMQVARLEQLLSQCLNEIKTIVQGKERFFWDREQ